MQHYIKVLLRVNFYPLFLFLAFLVWCYAFHGFVLGKLCMVSDAAAYQEHFKFFVDQFRRGVYPTWDASWSCGIPFEFFLRRIGSYNPFYSLIILLDSLGLTFLEAYRIFLALYFFVGMIGYYKLAYLVIHDRRLAFVAYLILMFSSLGTRLFDSYILFTFIPMVWFFYFLFAFAKTRSQHSFLGITFTLMILFSTYVPFYFITIFLSFVLFFALFYWHKFKHFLLSLFNFTRKHGLFVIFCLALFSAAFVPGVLLFKQGKKGDFVLTYRHSNVKNENAIEVDPQWNKWAVTEDVAYAGHFSNLKKFNFAVIYVPAFCYLLFLLGFIVPLNKKLVFLFVWGFMIFLIASPDVTGVYHFLYKHVFYFKYFRNLHFFLWIVLLPLGVLFLVEQLKNILQLKPRNTKEKWTLYLFITALHAGFLIYFVREGGGIASTYVMTALSWIFFLIYFSGKFLFRRALFLILLFTIIISQAIEVFHYLQKNSTMIEINGYRYDREYLKAKVKPADLTEYFNHVIQFEGPISYQNVADEALKPQANYFDTKWTSFLFKNFNRTVFDLYRCNHFLIYDRLEWIGQDIDMEKIGRSLADYNNLAFISGDKPPEDMGLTKEAAAPQVEIVNQASPHVKVIFFDVNDVRLKTNFPTKKFIVFNDSYFDGWQAFIDGKPTTIYRANVAFKGLWVPPGEHIVRYKFGYPWRYALDYCLLIIFYGTFIVLMIIWYHYAHRMRNINLSLRQWIKIGS